MSLDFLSCVQSFVAVAEYGGFSPAARHLQVSTPMLTNQLKRLEGSLGKNFCTARLDMLRLPKLGKFI